MTMVKLSRFLIVLAPLPGIVAASPSAWAQDAIADHFRGKTISVVIPTAPGGDRMTNAAPFMKYFGRHVPGNPNVVPQFMPGAGGAVGMNYLQSAAARDGLTIATPLAPVVIAQVTGEKSVRYDLAKMNWIGRTADATQVLYVWHLVDVKDAEGLKTTKVMIGSSGPSSASTIIPYVMNHVFDMKMQVVLGYSGSAAFNLAVERRETDGALTTWNNLSNNHADQIRQKRFRILFQVALKRNKDLPEVPLAIDMATNDNDRALLEFLSSSSEMGQSFVAPPDVPKPVVDALRRAFDATMSDPDYIALMKQTGNALNPMGGSELAEINARTLATPPSVIQRYQTAVSPPR
jgi:tripartite-type tricarboxylate transporter receptor subunit TctC